MSKYKFVKYKDIENSYDTTKVIIQLDANSLPELLEAFEDFLRASSFSFDGHLEIVKDDES